MFTPNDCQATYAISSLLIFVQTSYILFLHHVLPILHICFVGAHFGQRAYAQRLDKMIIIWVVGPPIGWTSPPTNWSDCSAFTSPPTSWLDCSSHVLHHQLCWRLASYARDSSVFGFFVQASPSKPGTPWHSNSSCKSHQLS